MSAFSYWVNLQKKIFRRRMSWNQHDSDSETCWANGNHQEDQNSTLATPTLVQQARIHETDEASASTSSAHWLAAPFTPCGDASGYLGGSSFGELSVDSWSFSKFVSGVFKWRLHCSARNNLQRVEPQLPGKQPKLQSSGFNQGGAWTSPKAMVEQLP